MTAPLVSVGIPLYRSARFFEIVAGNIERIDYPDLEFLVSDRHMEDDTIERLARRFAEDPRVRFLRGRDGIHWVAHYNLLLREARGRYFCWMPHDDTFPGDWVGRCVSYLARHPDVILACGHIRIFVAGGGGDRAKPGTIAAPDTEPPRSVADALELLRNPRLGGAMRGVFRRDDIVNRRLWMRYPRNGVFADVYWLFALALIGRLAPLDDLVCDKRYYSDSTHARWRASCRDDIGSLFLLGRYIHQLHGLRPRAARYWWAAVLWTITRLWQRLPKKLRRVCALALRFLKHPLCGIRRMRTMGRAEVLWRLRGNVPIQVKRKSPRSGGP